MSNEMILRDRRASKIRAEHRHRAGFWVLLLVCAAVLAPAADAAPTRADGTQFVVPFPPPPKAPGPAQECMDDLLKNLDRCREACCLNFLWLELFCDTSCLIICQNAAEATFEKCLTGGCAHC